MGELLIAIKNIWNKYKAYIIMGLALLVTLGFLFISCSNNANLKHKYDINTKALTDTIEYYQTKSGQLAAEKSILQGDIKDLKKLNEDLYKKVKDLEVKKPEQVVYVETQVIHEVHDTTYIYPEINDYLKQSFDFSNQWRTLTGYIEYDKPNLNLIFDKDIVNVDYTLAIKDNNVYITSSNPYVRYNEIQGISLPPRKNPMFSVGVGPSFGVGYGLVNKKFDIWAGISLNINYNLISFGQKR